MIQIERLPRPEELTDEIIKKKTESFSRDINKAVWKEPYIHSRLMAMSNNKCCYCEIKLGEEGKYMEVEHFHDKNDYPQEVVQWDNLLPSCKTCNDKKGTLDTYKYPIINPCIDKPQDHMYLYNLIRYKKIDDIGETTIIELDLNNTEQRTTPRFFIIDELNQKLEDIVAMSSSLAQDPQTAAEKAKQTRFRNTITKLLQEGQPTEEYSAIVSTAILENPDYIQIKETAISFGIWTEEHQKLESALYSIKYQTKCPM